MLNTQVLDQMSKFSRALDNTASVTALNHTLTQSFKEIGVKMFIYYHIPTEDVANDTKTTVMSHYGFPEAWNKFYQDNKFCDNDPVLGYIQKEKRAIKWQELLNSNIENPRDKEYIKAANDLQVGIGIALPVFGTHTQSGVFSLGFQPRCETLRDIEMSMLQWACQMAHHKWLDLVAEPEEQSLRSVQQTP